MEQPADSSTYRSLLRLVGGGVAFATDRVSAIEAALPSGDEEGASEISTALAVFFGFAAEVPGRVAAAVETAERLAAPVVSVTRPVRNVLADTLPGRMTAAFVEALVEETERLASVGRVEIARGRRLVAAVYDASVDGILGNLVENENLDELVADQAMGVTRGAVQEVRETSAAADLLTESMFRRVLGRPARPIPPKPAGAT